jgi:nucleotide-binding universal stress UspA family protein
MMLTASKGVQTMFAKALVPTDFSPAADRLLDCLDEISALGCKEVVLLHVTDVRQSHNLLGFDLTYLDRHNELARAELERRRQKVESLGLTCRAVQVDDVPDHGIVETAKKEQCGVIVIGSHGRTSLSGVLLGSTSEKVVRQSPVPVLLVKHRVVEEMGRQVCDFAFARMVRKALVPTDFSTAAERTLDLVRGLRDAGLEEIVLLHVQDVRKLRPHLSERMDEFNRVDTQRLDALRADLKLLGFSVRTRLAEGVPSEEILRVADEEDAGFIVMGTHGRSAVAEILLGSVSTEVIQRSRQPILVVRSPLETSHADR